jgi:hypothetical protein
LNNVVRVLKQLSIQKEIFFCHINVEALKWRSNKGDTN